MNDDRTAPHNSFNRSGNNAALLARDGLSPALGPDMWRKMKTPGTAIFDDRWPLHIGNEIKAPAVDVPASQARFLKTPNFIDELNGENIFRLETRVRHAVPGSTI